MNRTYKLVFNRHFNVWQAVSELASAGGKSGGKGGARAVFVASALAGLLGLFSTSEALAKCVNVTRNIEYDINSAGSVNDPGPVQPLSGESVLCTPDAPNPIISKQVVISAAAGSSNVNVTLEAGTVFSPTPRAIGIVNNSTVLNQGSIKTTGVSGYAVAVTGSGSTVINEGDILTSGQNGQAVYVGPISGASGLFSNNTLINSGTIRVLGQNASGFQVVNAPNTIITNTGVIDALGINRIGTGTAPASVLVGTNSNGATVTNSGTILSQTAPGVMIQSSGATVINSGTITSTSGTTDPAIIGAGISLPDDVAVLFSAGGNTLILQTGSTLNGNVLSDVKSGNRIRLQGTGSEDSYFYGSDVLDQSAGTAYLNGEAGSGFEQLTMGDANTSSDDQWNLSGKILLTGEAADSVHVQAGTLVLGGNDYLGNSGGDITTSGGITIDGGGTLQMGIGGSSGAVTDASGNFTVDVIDDGTLILNRADDLVYAGVISGTGNLQHLGASALILTGENTYAGNTRIASGATLQIGDYDAATSTGGTSGHIGSVTSITNDGTLAFNRVDDLTLKAAITGTGALTQNGVNTVILTGENSYTGGTVIASGATLQIGDYDAVSNTGGGSGSILFSDIVDDGALAFNRAGNTTVGGAISGNGTVTQNGPGIVSLTGANTYASDTVIRNGTVQLGDGNASGSVVSDIDTGIDTINKGTLAFNRADDVSFGNLIYGTGGISQNGTGTTQLTNLNTFTGGVTVTAGTLAIDLAQSDSATNLSSGAINILGGTLDVSSDGSADFLFNNALGAGSAAGTLRASNGGKAFNFAANAGNAFTGTVALADNTFALTTLNAATLANATLRLDDGNITTAGAGNPIPDTVTLGSLAFNGGTLVFSDRVLTGNASPPHIVTTLTLDLRGTGTVQIDTTNFDNAVPASLPLATLPLLEHDDGLARSRLIQADGLVLGSGGGLSLVNQDGDPISDAETTVITQNGVNVAQGTYDFRLTASAADDANPDGLYVAYTLAQVNLGGTGVNALSLTPSVAAVRGSATDLSAKLIGTGDLTIAAGAGNLVSLSNPTNDYTGQTRVASGVLLLDADNALGRTSLLRLDTDATLDLDGQAQTIGEFDGATDSTLNLNGGSLIVSAVDDGNGNFSTGLFTGAIGSTQDLGSGGVLTLDNGGTADGVLQGSGVINLNGGDFAVTDANANLDADVNIASSASATLDDVAGLGNTRTVTLAATDSTLNFNDVGAGALSKNISGLGNLNINGASDITLSGDNSNFSGAWNVSVDSILTASEQSHFGSAAIHDDGTVILSKTGTLLNDVSGTGAMNLINTAEVILAGNNSGFSGVWNVASGTRLTASEQNHFGTAAINDNGTVFLSATGTLQNDVSGTGAMNLADNADVIVTGDNSGFSGAWNIANGSSLTGSSQDNLGSAAINNIGTLALDAYVDDLQNNINGAGNVNVVNNADVIITGDNTNFFGIWNIEANSKLTAAEQNDFGTAAIRDDGTVLLSATGTLLNNVSGTGVMTLGNIATVRVAGDNSAFSGLWDVVSGATLTGAAQGNFGTAAISNEGIVVLSPTYIDAFANDVSGGGIVAVQGSDIAITGANTLSGQWDISGTASITPASLTSQTNLGAAEVFLDGAESGLSANTNGNFIFDNALTGDGTLSADNNGGDFSFSASVGSDFAGTVSLSNNRFALDDDNTAALTNATLQINDGNVTTVGAAPRAFHGLTFNGGTMIFDATIPDVLIAANGVTVDTLTFDPAGGTIEVTIAQNFTPPDLNSITSPNLLEQDNDQSFTRLISATTVVGAENVSALNAVDQLGDDLSAKSGQVNIQQLGTTVAIGSYGFDLASSNGGADDGLYVTWGLTQLNLQATQTLTLAQDVGAVGADATLSAKVTGAGSLAIDAGAGSVILDNASNDYTGDTTALSGILLLGSDNALGKTNLLTVNTNATADFAEHAQTAGAVTTQTGSTLNVNAGALTISASQRAANVSSGGFLSADTLSGTTDASVTLDASQLLVDGDQADYSGTITVAAGSQLVANSASAFNSATGIALASDADTLTFSRLDAFDAAAPDTQVNGIASTAISGFGTTAVLNGAAVTFAGDNSGFLGTFEIDNTSTLQASAQSNLGFAAIENDGTVTLDAYDDTLLNAVSGAGTMALTNASDVTITGNNINFTGAWNVDADSRLTGSTQNHFGAAAIENAGNVVLDAYSGALQNDVSGDGTVSLSNASVVTLTGDNSGFTSDGVWDVQASATMNVSAQNQLGDAELALAGTANLASAAAFTLGNELTGDGLLTVATGAGNAFNFAATTGDAFTGTVELNASTFALSGDNTLALTNATLQINADNITTVGDDNQEIDALIFNGGTMIFNATAPDQTVATSRITADTLTLNAGTVQINLPAPYVLVAPTLPDSASLFAQSHPTIDLQLIAATTSGNVTSLILQDQNGNDISDAQQTININQGGNPVATGSYGYALSVGGGDGLYVGYGLTQLNLLTTLTLTEDAGAVGNDMDLAAKLTGTGNLNVAALNTLILSNANNDFTGTATISSGTLRAGADDVIATASAVSVNAGANFDTNGFAQSVNNLGGGGNVLLNGNLLTLHADPASAFAGVISGNGAVTLAEGTQILTGANTYTGGTTIDSGATLQLGANGASGSLVGNVTGDGTLAFNRNNAYAFAGNISGAVAVAQNGTGTTTLNGVNTHSGATSVNTGTLAAGAANTFSPNSVMTVASGAAVELGGFNQTLAGLNNGGTVRFNAAIPTTLTITGNYVGINGLIEMNTVLGADNSPSDKLVIDGGTASGSTTLAVTNVGGLGAATTGDGIMLVQALNGATTASNAFTLQGDSISAGAFVYRLKEGDLTGSGENWFLRTDALPDPDVDPGEEPADEYRPEVPLITALSGILRQGDLDMAGSLQKRMGDDLHDYTDGFRYSGRAWARAFASDIKQTSNGNLTTPTASGSNQGVQLGVDLLEMTNAGKRTDIGVYIGWLNSDANIDGLIGQAQEMGRTGKVSLATRALGAYWTHKEPNGFYSDLVIQYSRYNGDGVSVDDARIDVGGSGMLYSLEGGYSFRLNDGWTLEPQAQLIRQRGRLDDMTIPNALVSFNDPWQTIGRIGARLSNEMRLDSGLLKPYARANIWHGFDATQTVNFTTPTASIPIKTDSGYTSGEIGAGLTWSVTDKLSLYGEVSRLFSMDNNAGQTRKGTAGSVGVRWDW